MDPIERKLLERSTHHEVRSWKKVHVLKQEQKLKEKSRNARQLARFQAKKALRSQRNRATANYPPAPRHREVGLPRRSQSAQKEPLSDDDYDDDGQQPQFDSDNDDQNDGVDEDQESITEEFRNSPPESSLSLSSTSHQLLAEDANADDDDESEDGYDSESAAAEELKKLRAKNCNVSHEYPAFVEASKRFGVDVCIFRTISQTSAHVDAENVPIFRVKLKCWEHNFRSSRPLRPYWPRSCTYPRVGYYEYEPTIRYQYQLMLYLGPHTSLRLSEEQVPDQFHFVVVEPQHRYRVYDDVSGARQPDLTMPEMHVHYLLSYDTATLSFEDGGDDNMQHSTPHKRIVDNNGRPKHPLHHRRTKRPTKGVRLHRVHLALVALPGDTLQKILAQLDAEFYSVFKSYPDDEFMTFVESWRALCRFGPACARSLRRTQGGLSRFYEPFELGDRPSQRVPIVSPKSGDTARLWSRFYE